MFISSLSSGSSGNCFYIKDRDNAILIDVGISCRQTLLKLSLLKENHCNIRGIFITHAHSDHIKGVDVLSRHLNIPVYATQGTMNQRMLCSNPDNLIRIKNNETIRISGIEMTAFSKSHDCADPVSFVISSPKTNKKISVITDLGEINESAVDAISESDFLAIESNYDEKMLEVGPYPYFLKQRIAGPGGHLSNRISSLKVLENSKSRLKNILLCHLSKVNNSPDNALKTFSQTLRHRTDLSPKIRVAPRYFHTELLRI